MHFPLGLYLRNVSMVCVHTSNDVRVHEFFIFEWIIPSTSKDSDGVVIASIIKSCLGLSNQPNPDILLTGKNNQPHRDTRFLLCPCLGLGVRGKGYDHKLMSTDGALVQRRPWRELKCHANASHEPKHKSPALPTGHRWVKQCLFQTWINFNLVLISSTEEVLKISHARFTAIGIRCITVDPKEWTGETHRA